MLRLLVLFILLPFCSFAQNPFTVDLWLNESNTPVKINDMGEDAQGYVWLGTDLGVFRFNGRSFLHIPDSIDKPVTAVDVSGNDVFVGYQNGAIGKVTENFISKVPVHNAPHSRINAIKIVAPEQMILSTESGIYIISSGIGIRIDRSNGLTDNFIYHTEILEGHRLLAATDIGINEISIKNKKLYIIGLTDADGLPDNIVRLVKQVPGKNWCWIGMQQRGLALYCTDTKKIWQPFSEQGWEWGEVNDILPIDEMRAWVCTEDGFLLKVQLKDSASSNIEVIRFSDKRIKKLVRGRSGLLWCGTNNGITLVSDEYMSAISLHTPYKLSEIRAMTCDKKDVIWFSQGTQVFKLLPQARQQSIASIKLPADITCLYADADNRLWIGTLGKGLWYRDTTGTLEQVKDIAPLVDENVLDIAATDDRIWVSGLNGVEELSYPGSYTHKISLIKQHKKSSGIGSDYVYQTYPDKKGQVWMATDGAGVRMYHDGRYRKWDTASGMTSDVIYNITQDALGNIWAVSFQNGLYRYDGRMWEQIGKEQGLQDVNISTVSANATGQVVVVHNKGIDVWYPLSKQFRNYQMRQPFGIDSISNVLKLEARDTAGNVYIPYEEGFIIFRNIKQPFDIRPIVNISSVSVFFNPVEAGKKEFSYDQNHISFHFDAISFANAEQLRYRYKLEGYNEDWIITNDESATFPQLGTGNYKFRVQASLNNNFSEYGESNYAFTIEKPFWFRTWFIIVGIAGVLSLVYVYISMRERNLRKLASLQRERMIFEYEHLKSQVNPHFLFNSLNTLTNLIDENTNAAIDYTVRLSDLYRNMLSYRDKDLIFLKEEWDILEDYLYIQKCRFGEALRIAVDVSDSIKESKKIVPMALQLLVENAIKHNVVSKARPLIIKITASADVITVSNPIQSKLSKEKGAGLGLANIRKRYSLLTKQSILIDIHENNFVVKLPLI